MVDPRELPWESGQTREEGITFQCQVYLSAALTSGPEAIRFRFDPCRRVYAHMASRLAISAPAGRHHRLPEVHHEAAPARDTSRGPQPSVRTLFDRRGTRDAGVASQTGRHLVSMAESGSAQANLSGRTPIRRDRIGIAEWFQVAEYEGAQCKFLIPPGSGPEATIVTCPPNAILPVPAAPYGRYQVILDQW